ncbi:hypothetical protein F2Q69_00007591 [Brassica cretica]|uniref:Uncharacterized protein n=1 Tax=Brassica cretica TaxID=69181 RepID=A0A8S9PB03_BRACR|nr:hypothetical protein F2Q69_00007591 [Brassica cretica]
MDSCSIDVLGVFGRYVGTEPCACSVATDRAVCLLGRYVANELRLELGRYVATELWPEFGRYVAIEPCVCSVATRVRARSLRSDRAVCVLGRYVATELGLCMVRLPYSSLLMAGLDTCLLPWDNRTPYILAPRNLTFILPYEPSKNRHKAYGSSVKKSDRAVCVLGPYVATKLRSDQASARARSLRSDRAVCVLGRYVATELWLELGRYVPTEPRVCSVAT